MAHWAKINDSKIVENVLKAEDYSESWLIENFGGKWLKTSYNTHNGIHYNPDTNEPSEDQSKALRGNYAGIGYSYNEELDAFIPPKPFDSWILNESIYSWVAPVPYPEDGKDYMWDEDTTSWVEVTNETPEEA